MRVIRENILVVEDEPDLQELIRFNLDREGYRVGCTASGREALQMIRESEPDLIVLDIILPEMDGREVCRILKADAKTKQIPIIMVTAMGEDTDIVAGLAIGADDYLPKPFSPKVLIARIRALLRRKNASQLSGEEPIKVEGLTIHPGRFEVIVDNSAVDLSATEFRILLTLAKSPGWVFTRYQIVNKARGDDSIVTDRSVDVHMTHLRRKLGSYGKLIQTVRGVGYRFRA